MFSLANYQVSFPSQIYFKNSECECSWQQILEATKTPVKHFKIRYFNFTENGI